MEFKFQKRRGIGNVITTLIILIASVVLGAGVIFFGGSMFSTNTQSEQVKVTNINSWVGDAALGTNSTTAFAIQNVGSKAVTVTDIKLRGIAVPTANWYSCKDCAAGTAGATNIQTPLPYDPTESSVTIGGTLYTMTAAQQVSLSQGEAAIVYLSNAGNIEPLDAGNTYALQIQAGQASSVTQVSVEQK
jgi:hypothetical protein